MPVPATGADVSCHDDGPFRRQWQRSGARSTAQTGALVEDDRLRTWPHRGWPRPFGWLYRMGAATTDRGTGPRTVLGRHPSGSTPPAARAFTLLVDRRDHGGGLPGHACSRRSITFVADDFDADRTTQGLVTGLTRIGALLALLVVVVADGRPRRSPQDARRRRYRLRQLFAAICRPVAEHLVLRRRRARSRRGFADRVRIAHRHLRRRGGARPAPRAWIDVDPRPVRRAWVRAWCCG